MKKITRRIFLKFLALALPASTVPLAPMGSKPTPPPADFEPSKWHTERISEKQWRELFGPPNLRFDAIQFYGGQQWSPAQRRRLAQQALNRIRSKALDCISKKA